MKKAVSVILLCVLLSISLSLSAFASSSYFNLSSVEVKQGVSASSSSWADVTDLSVWYPSSGGRLDIRTSGFTAPLYGIRASFNADAYVKVQSGYYFIFYYTVIGDLYSANSINSGTYFNSYVKDSTGTVHELSSVISSTASEFTVTCSGHIGDGSPFSFGELSFETNLQTGTNTSIYLTMEITTALTPEQERNEQLMESIKENSQAIIDNQNQNTQDIIDNNNANTDKIVNGWESDDDTSGDIKDYAGDLTDAENDALGGKSDQQIQDEVNDALHGGAGGSFGNDTISGVQSVGSVFDDLLGVFGTDYETFLYLALALGFSAFLIGRQYRARGD